MLNNLLFNNALGIEYEVVEASDVSIAAEGDDDDDDDEIVGNDEEEVDADVDD